MFQVSKSFVFSFAFYKPFLRKALESGHHPNKGARHRIQEMVPSLRNQGRQSLGWLEGMAHENSGMDGLGLLFPGQEAPGLN